jgi:quercetin dioxygenase-like cupin family protein
MTTMLPGVLPAGSAVEDTVWHILGQTYVPKHRCESSMSWHATFPAGTFVPPHMHLTQDEFIYVLEGRFDLLLDGEPATAGPGDLIHLPRNTSHGFFNKTDQTLKCLFWVSPTNDLWELFTKIDGLPDPAELMRIAALHKIEFLPPPAN